MATKTISELIPIFQDGAIPDGQDFADLVDSCRNNTLELANVPDGTTFNLDQCTFTFQGGVAVITNNAATGALNIPWQPFPCSIGSSAFQFNSNITSLSIPSSVTVIKSMAFLFCQTITGSLLIPDSVTSIEGQAFQFCNGLTGSLIIGNSVTSIGERAFNSCQGFQGNLTIPDSVLTIGTDCFRDCVGLTSLTIGNSIVTIGEQAFYQCSSIAGDLTIPNSVNTLGDSAFQGCSGLTNVNCYVTRDIMNSNSCLAGTSVSTLHARASDTTWSAGSDVVCGIPLTVIMDL